MLPVKDGSNTTANNNNNKKLCTLMQADQNMPDKILCLLEQQSSQPLSGKCLIFFSLFLKTSPSILQSLSKTKFFVIIDKLLQEQSKYVQTCLLQLIGTIEETVPTLMNVIHDELVVVHTAT